MLRKVSHTSRVIANAIKGGIRRRAASPSDSPKRPMKSKYSIAMELKTIRRPKWHAAAIEARAKALKKRSRWDDAEEEEVVVVDSESTETAEQLKKRKAALETASKERHKRIRFFEREAVIRRLQRHIADLGLDAIALPNVKGTPITLQELTEILSIGSNSCQVHETTGSIYTCTHQILVRVDDIFTMRFFAEALFTLASMRRLTKKSTMDVMRADEFDGSTLTGKGSQTSDDWILIDMGDIMVRILLSENTQFKVGLFMKPVPRSQFSELSVSAEKCEFIVKASSSRQWAERISIPEAILSVKPLKCDHCKAEFIDRRKLRTHMIEEHIDEIIRCKCTKNFYTKRSFEMHLKKVEFPSRHGRDDFKKWLKDTSKRRRKTLKRRQ